MHPLTAQIAAFMASTDGIPRLIRRVTSLFLVTPQGDVWRIFDSIEPDGDRRSDPTDDPSVLARIFVAGGADPIVRIYRFPDAETRSIIAQRLVQQFGSATLIGQP